MRSLMCCKVLYLCNLTEENVHARDMYLVKIRGVGFESHDLTRVGPGIHNLRLDLDLTQMTRKSWLFFLSFSFAHIEPSATV